MFRQKCEKIENVKPAKMLYDEGDEFTRKKKHRSLLYKNLIRLKNDCS